MQYYTEKSEDYTSTQSISRNVTEPSALKTAIYFLQRFILMKDKNFWSNLVLRG